MSAVNYPPTGFAIGIEEDDRNLISEVTVQHPGECRPKASMIATGQVRTCIWLTDILSDLVPVAA